MCDVYSLLPGPCAVDDSEGEAFGFHKRTFSLDLSGGWMSLYLHVGGESKYIGYGKWEPIWKGNLSEASWYQMIAQAWDRLEAEHGKKLFHTGLNLLVLEAPRPELWLICLQLVLLLWATLFLQASVSLTLNGIAGRGFVGHYSRLLLMLKIYVSGFL